MIVAHALLLTLAAGPAAFDTGAPAVRCHGCVLLAQTTAPSPPAEAPPFSAETATDRELQQRILALNHESRSIDVNWPPGLTLMAYTGYISAALGLGFLSVAITSPGLFLTVGIVALVAGLVFIGIAWVAGSSITTEKKQRREAVVREREILEEELRFRRSQGPQQIPSVSIEPVRPLITLAVF